MLATVQNYAGVFFNWFVNLGRPTQYGMFFLVTSIFYLHKRFADFIGFATAVVRVLYQTDHLFEFEFSKNVASYACRSAAFLVLALVGFHFEQPRNAFKIRIAVLLLEILFVTTFVFWIVELCFDIFSRAMSSYPLIQ